MEQRVTRSLTTRSAALAISDALAPLQRQLDDLTAQFHGFSSPRTSATLTRPNDPTLSSDFTHAQSFSPPAHSPSAHPSKSVRFSDTETLLPYRDEVPTPPSERHAQMSNTQIHEYHSSVLTEQDDQLDRLGESISRQRELSMRMGDELEAQVEMLDETDGAVDRHAGRLDRAGRSLAGVARRAKGEGRQMVAIVVTIIILILLIVILK